MKNHDKNIQIYQSILKSKQQLFSTITQYLNQLESYISIASLQEFHYKENETYQQNIQRGESCFDKNYECYLRNNKLIDIEEQMKKQLCSFSNLTNEISNERQIDKKELESLNNEILKQLKTIENSQRIEFTMKYPKLENRYEMERLESEKNNYDEYEIETEEMVDRKKREELEMEQNKIQEMMEETERFKKIEGSLDLYEMKQIEHWCERFVNNIVFDSSQHLWNRKNVVGKGSEFDLRIIGKGDLLFIIQTTDGIKIGCYIRESIKKIDEWITDKNAFVFTLKSFESTKYHLLENEEQYAIKICNAKEENLMIVGNGDICVKKENKKELSSCKQTSFNYGNYSKALVGKDIFTISRIHVIQMIESNNKQYTFTNTPENAAMFEKMRVIAMEKERERKQSLQLEEMTDLYINETIFDSTIDDWKENTTEFDKKIMHRRKLIFLIEDTEANIFGCYIDTSIDKTFQMKLGELKGKSIKDPNSFIFSINPFEGNYTKYPIIYANKDSVFQLHKAETQILFSVGNGDICVMKENNKEKSSCKPTSFNYQTPNKRKNTLLIGTIDRENTFTPKRIRVIQMYETEEMSLIKEQRKKNFEEHQKSLLHMNSQIFLEKNENLISLLEEWTEMKYKEIIFDTYACNWSVKLTDFDKILFGKEKLIILIEDDEKNVFGCYIDAKIDKYRFIDNGEWKGKSIKDPKAFVFSIESNNRIEKPTFFPIKYNCNDFAFTLYENDYDELFSIGGNDICVKKYNSRQFCYCKQKSFDYEQYENVLVGTTGNDQPFLLKRMQVIQFYETDQMKEERKMNRMKKEFEQIEEWTGLKCSEMLFDSNVHDWKQKTSLFDKIIFGKSNLAFIIEDTNQNKFGCFISSKIDKYRYYENKEWNGERIYDEKAFVFTLRSNNRVKCMKKYNVIENEEDMESAFTLYKQNWGVLFSVGRGNDICIKKENYANKCYCDQMSFNYGDDEDCLVGESGEDSPFTVKNIQVVQLCETDEIRKQREEKERIELEKENEMIQKNFTELKESPNNIIQQLEEWSRLECRELLFDTEIHSWKKRKSVFHQKLFNKEKIMIVIEDEEGNIFGVYVNERINRYRSFVNEEWKGEFIKDAKSFVFVFKGNERIEKPMKFDVKYGSRDHAFAFFDNSSPYLFIVGKEKDICIYKENMKNECTCGLSSDYFGKENHLIGKVGDENPFTVKRIQVLQMMKTEKAKKMREEQRLKEEKEKQKKMEEENKILKQHDVTIKTELKDEIAQLEQWTELKYHELLFDSTVNNWSQYQSTFDQKLTQKRRIGIIIEDEENNMFGCFISKQIVKRGEHMKDEHAFIFSLHSNDRYKGMIKFDIKPTWSDWAFILAKQSVDVLFSVGSNDICIYKENNKTKCYCKASSFSYNDKEELLVGKIGFDNPFTVKRIRVIQFFEPEEMKEIKEIQKRNEIAQLEEWIGLKYKEVIFDSDISEWRQGKSVFDKRIFGKDKMAFVIEDSEHNKFGCFINNVIDQYRYVEDGKWKGERISDEKAFIFTLRSNGRVDGMKKYDIKPEEKQNAFVLYKNNWGILFSVGGGNDICIRKENHKTECYCKPKSFVYTDMKKVLTGKIGESYFKVKRIIVYQFA